MLFSTGPALGDAHQAPHGRTEIWGCRFVLDWKPSQELADELLDTGVVIPGVATSSLDHVRIKGNVKAFLGHGSSIRITVK